MTKRMLIDATHAEETRVVVLDGNRLEDFDVETSTKKQLKGNIYLAKVVRVEPSLQAAFVEYGGNRHGFLAFGEIHPDYYQIPIADRQRLLALQEAEARAEEEAEERADAALHGQHATPEAVHQPVIAADPDTSAAEPAAGEPPVEDLGADLAPEAAEPVAVEAPAPHAGDHAAASEATADETEPQAPAPEITAEAAPQGGDHDLPAMAAEPDHDREDSEGEAGDGESTVESLGAEAAAPEMVGGDHDAGDERDERERRIPSRHLRNYKIQEVIRRRQILLVQVVKEERGTKGAALTTYISLAGRFCVLMPNSPRGGGVSRKITSTADRKRLREAVEELDIPRGMGMIVRTAGANRPKPEIKRDCEYLLRLWDDIRDKTMQSVAPALINEEASLIKRAIRDVYSRDVEEILVDGEAGWRAARDFMRMLMPSHARKVILWQDPSTAGAQSLFARQQVEAQLDAMLSPTVQLKSGGYLVINQTEALVAIDVNSGRSTRERGIEETALRTNLEAADETARQLRLRDLAGLIVIDFIDMESKKHNAMVERRLKDALKVDRARIQVGTISHFGLMEMSRQRLRPSLAETSFVTCPHCGGLGHVRSTESAAMHVLRAIEEEGAKRRAAEIMVHVAGGIALYILNHKRAWLAEIEARHFMQISFSADDTLLPPAVRIDRLRPQLPPEELPTAPVLAAPVATAAEVEDADAYEEADEFDAEEDETAEQRRPHVAAPGVANGQAANGAAAPAARAETSEEAERRRRRRRRRRRGGRREDGLPAAPNTTTGPMELDADQPDVGGFTAGATAADAALTHSDMAAVQASLLDRTPDMGDVADDEQAPDAPTGDGQDDAGMALRRRGRRGGRRRRGGIGDDAAPAAEQPAPRMPAYVGPTPADPFGGQTFDIFDVIEQQALQAATPRPIAEPPSPPVLSPTMPSPTASPVAEAALPLEPEAEPVAEFPQPPAEPQAPEPEATPAIVAEVVSIPADATEALPAAAAPATETEAAPPAAPVKRARAPRKPRQPKSPAVAAVSKAEAAAPEPAAAAVAEEPVREEAVPEAVNPATDPVDAPTAPPVDAESPAAAVAGPVIKPVLVGIDEAPAEKKRGWWRR
jgi:ribonuclease E